MRTNHTTTGIGIAVLVATAISIVSSPVVDADGHASEDDATTLEHEATTPEHVRRNYDLMLVNMEGVGILPAATELWTGDAKDHPNYGQITVEQVDRPDAKDHPNYGQITVEQVDRPDAKDHPNYGPVTSADDVTDRVASIDPDCQPARGVVCAVQQ
jgi:hypothetical protein